jgi:hypothetical protein
VTGDAVLVVSKGIVGASAIYNRLMELIPYAAPIITSVILIVLVMRFFVQPLVGAGVSDLARNTWTEVAKSGGKHSSGHIKWFSSKGGKFAKKGKK